MNGPPIARGDFYVEAPFNGLNATALSASTPRTGSVFVVTTLADTGDGSLRKAILDANANPGTDIINFDVPGAGVQTIFPMQKLPNITDPVIIDGTTQSGYAGSPLIVIDGTDLFGFDMIDVFANECVIRGLAINRVRGGTGIVLYGDSNTVVGNYIGLDPSGTSAPGIQYNGIILLGASNRVGGTLAANRNYFAGTGSPAIALSGLTATGNIVEGNFIGTDPTGTVKLGTSGESVIIINGASNNIVGGAAAGARNILAGLRSTPASAL